MPASKKTIRVSLSAFGLAREHYQSGSYQLKQGARVKALLKRARRPGTRSPPQLVYMIEGQRVEPSRRLAEGEDLKILHAAYGG